MAVPDISTLEATLGYRFHRPELLQQALTHSSHAHEMQMNVGQISAGYADHADVNGADAPYPPAPDIPDSSASARHDDVRHDNQLMEFLGDAVLGFVTSQALFRRFPNLREGQLSKLRAHLVSARHLAKVAHAIGLGEYLRLGHGEEKSGGRSKATLRVDA